MQPKYYGVLFLLVATLLFALHDATSKHLFVFFSVPLLVWARYLIYIVIMLVGVAPVSYTHLTLPTNREV